MIALLKKEIRSFLSSFIGYIVVAVFLLAIGLFMWVFPGNVLDGNEANMDALFFNAPIVFVFLVPAICMRSFAEEHRTGTIELLFTKPITDINIVLAKYFASLLLVLFSLIPTLFYFYSINQLSDPVGNVDSGKIWGSYLGLFFLGAAFVSISTFASSITKNQVIAFILSLFLCFFIYIGFQSIGSFELFGSFDSVIINLGVIEHYISISKGVLDTRDILYFLSLSIFFILLTKFSLQSRRW